MLTPRIYHERTALAIVCPITSNIDPYPFKVTLPDGLADPGAVLGRPGEVDRSGGAAAEDRGARAAPPCSSRCKVELAALLGLDPD